MKNPKLLIILFLTSITNSLFSQSVFNFKNDMVWIDKAKLFVCKYETSNAEYHTFINDLIKDASNQAIKDSIFQNHYPDTLNWGVEMANHSADPMMEYYSNHPSFQGYPVVNINLASAKLFCNWMTRKYGEGKYKFRIPHEQEYLNYSQVDTFKYAGGFAYDRDSKKGYFNFNHYTRTLNYDSLNSDGELFAQLFYNPLKKSFCYLYKSIGKYDESPSFHSEQLPEGFDYHVECLIGDKLFLSGRVKSKWRRLMISIPNSFTIFDQKTNISKNSKLRAKYTKSNYYDDGFMYMSPTRIYKYKNRNYEMNDRSDKGKIQYNKSAYQKDKNGLYDLAGNVSEMVECEHNSSCAMGGNWSSPSNECTYNARYISAKRQKSVCIGFRIVAEAIK